MVLSLKRTQLWSLQRAWRWGHHAPGTGMAGASNHLAVPCCPRALAVPGEGALPCSY